MCINDCFIPILICSICTVLVLSLIATIITNTIIKIVQIICKRKKTIYITKEELKEAFKSEQSFEDFVYGTLIDRINDNK